MSGQELADIIKTMIRVKAFKIRYKRQYVEPVLSAGGEDTTENFLSMSADAVRLPLDTLRLITAGRMACSADQMIASISGSYRNFRIS